MPEVDKSDVNHNMSDLLPLEKPLVSEVSDPSSDIFKENPEVLMSGSDKPLLNLIISDIFPLEDTIVSEESGSISDLSKEVTEVDESRNFFSVQDGEISEHSGKKVGKSVRWQLLLGKKSERSELSCVRGKSMSVSKKKACLSKIEIGLNNRFELFDKMMFQVFLCLR